MVNSAFHLFLLRGQTFMHFNFPRWQSVLTISLIGGLVGLDPSLRAAPADVPISPLWFAVATSLVMVWLSFLVIVAVLRWWMKLGGRWDGQGDLFNLVAASWLVADVLGAGLVAMGVPSLLTFPLWLYSVWVGCIALAGAVPKASRAYCLSGIAIGFIPALLVSGLAMTLGGAVFSLLGGVPVPSRA